MSNRTYPQKKTKKLNTGWLPNGSEILKNVSGFVNISQWSIDLFLYLITFHDNDIGWHFENENIDIIARFERQTVMIFCVSLISIVKV
jgi:hypothetical protein